MNSLEKNVSKNVAWLRGQYPFKEGLLILWMEFHANEFY